MKKFVLLFTMLVITSICFAQGKDAPMVNYSQRVDSLLRKIDTLLMVNAELLENIEADLSIKNRYRLYKTENIYTFLELDSKTGRVNQVQWSLDSEKELSVPIINVDLNFLSEGYGSNSFELYPTQNMYQFILLDKTNGRKWHVQWGMEESKRWYRRIW